MGYYSFYRIIKDILYNLKKNKILVIVAIIILILFFCNNIFASSSSFVYTFSGNEYTFSLPSWVLDNNYNYLVWISNEQTQKYGQFITCYLVVSKGDITTTTSTMSGSHNRTFYNSTDGVAILGWNRGQATSNNINTFLNNFSNLLEPSSFNNSITTGLYGIDSSSNPQYFCNTNIFQKDTTDLVFVDNSIRYPQVTTSLEDLQTLNFDTISVSAWDWSNKDLYILFYDRTLMNNENTEGLYPKKEIKLAKDTSYYVPEISSEENAIYWVANDNTGLNFKVGGKYEIRLAERVPQSTGRSFSWRRFV